MAANGSPPSEVSMKKALEVAELDMEYRVDLFNTLNHTCFNKCIDKRYKEGEPNMGESTCIDRCASKYWQVSDLIPQFSYGYMRKDNCVETNARN